MTRPFKIDKSLRERRRIIRLLDYLKRDDLTGEQMERIGKRLQKSGKRALTPLVRKLWQEQNGTAIYRYACMLDFFDDLFRQRTPAGYVPQIGGNILHLLRCAVGEQQDAVVDAQTPPGAAHLLGEGIDRYRIDDVAGTVAGDNTIIIVVSDNGSSAEGGPNGTFNEWEFFNGVPSTTERTLPHIDELGTPVSNNHYNTGWAWAFDTPAATVPTPMRAAAMSSKRSMTKVAIGRRFGNGRLIRWRDTRGNEVRE